MSQQLIANECLAFIKHAIDYMDEVSILQICKSSFNEEEISSAKLLLFQALGKVDQMQSRRRDGGQRSVQDIITMMKSTDPDDVPAFVAKELHKLPPVTFDHVDVTRLLKDITSLKASLAEMNTKQEVSNNTIDTLRAEVELLRNAVSVSRAPITSSLNVRCGAQNASISSFESASCSASPADKNACVASCSAADDAVSMPVEVVSHVGTLTPKRTYSAIVAANKSAVSQKTQQAGKVKRGKQECLKPHNADIKQRGLLRGSNEEDGFIKVEKKKKKKPPCQNQCGTALAGSNTLLRPALPTTQLYVSRLLRTTATEDIVEYVRVKTNWTLRVVQLESRHDTNFKSFVVWVPTSQLDTFLKGEFWPKGVVYRRFRGRIPNSQRNTKLSPRVQ